MLKMRGTGRFVVFLSGWRQQEPAVKCNLEKLTAVTKNWDSMTTETRALVKEQQRHLGTYEGSGAVWLVIRVQTPSNKLRKPYLQTINLQASTTRHYLSKQRQWTRKLNEIRHFPKIQQRISWIFRTMTILTFQPVSMFPLLNHRQVSFGC